MTSYLFENMFKSLAEKPKIISGVLRASALIEVTIDSPIPHQSAPV